ncbi:hypothetical protein [Geotalea toluenoxydans]|uniref:hypothetical protein n=1 Tax=Geotalea toluenoxydans TaxID=421624 RepID=UPI0006D2BEB9|nr:hypothetical protein [Geotalea toluenoxydans]
MEYSTKTKRLKKEADDAEINLYRLMIRLGKLISVRGKSLQFEDIEMQQAAFNLMVKADIHHKISQTYDELKPLLAVSAPMRIVRMKNIMTLLWGLLIK